MTWNQRLRRATYGLAFATCLAVAPATSSGQDLMGYWKLEEADVNADILDSSGRGLSGAVEGEVELGVEGAPGFGKGARFDGSTAHILIGPGDETGFGSLTSDFTVMAWMKPENFGHKNRVFGSAPHGGAGWGWGTNSDMLEITTWAVKDYDQPVPLELDTWVHAAIVVNADFEASFYVNGEYVGTQTHPDPGLETVNNFYIGMACCDTEHFEGSLDEVAVFSGSLTDAQIKNAMNLGADKFKGQVDPLAALDDGSLTDPAARATYIHTTLKTWVGDSNLDGQFNSADFVTVFAAGEYEDALVKNSKWTTGDWNGDKEFNSSDFVYAFTDGGYELGPRPAAVAIPEPNSAAWLLSMGLLLLGRRKRA